MTKYMVGRRLRDNTLRDVIVWLSIIGITAALWITQLDNVIGGLRLK